ncbi:hypothetical protein Pint_26515 [Pistacia integerrima]|uniref:Uncharacterized protein n=1 Tax=Pistacia integerrima TaxID=434235 RepID=A0ACC0YGH4_9ROSI|nr:hypothetical protein Pint_26515 [Pistacia integerrima]
MTGSASSVDFSRVAGKAGTARSAAIQNTSPDINSDNSAPPTKNGRAPPPIESRKSSQSVNPTLLCLDLVPAFKGSFSLATILPNPGD